MPHHGTGISLIVGTGELQAPFAGRFRTSKSIVQTLVTPGTARLQHGGPVCRQNIVPARLLFGKTIGPPQLRIRADGLQRVADALELGAFFLFLLGGELMDRFRFALALTFSALKRYGSDAGTRRCQSTFQRLAA